MVYNVFVDGEWIFSGDYENAQRIADSYYFDESYFYNVIIEAEEEA